jgi:glycogen synthase
LEAIRSGTPVVLSMTSGVAEVLHRGALKVDFWDVEDMANKILAVFTRPELAETLRRHGAEEIAALTWDEAARKCMEVYHEGIEAIRGSPRN